MSPLDVSGIATLPDHDDRETLVEMVQAFAHAEIGPLVERPEDPVGPDAVDDVLAQLADLGVLTLDSEPGLGIWDLPAEPVSCHLSMSVIGQVAEVSPGIAYALHLRALAGWLDRTASVSGTATAVSFDRIGAAAGRVTGRALAGGPVSDADVVVLEDAWGAPTSNHPQLMVDTNAWRHVWSPEWNTRDGWRLVGRPRTDLLLTPLRHAHGLDELAYHAGHLAAGGNTEPARVLGSEYVVDGFAIHGMGLLAIAAAAARRAVARARDYSLTRRQGGQVIGAHDAVAQLLDRSEQSLATARAVLDHLAGLPADLSRLHQVWRARAQLHPLLTAAGSDALQVFGGVGYMRDVGAEKDLRDLNTVRRLGGSPMELTLRCAGFDDSLGVVP